MVVVGISPLSNNSNNNDTNSNRNGKLLGTVVLETVFQLSAKESERRYVQRR